MRPCAYEDFIVAYDKGQLQLSKLISDMFRQRFPRVQLTRTLPIYSRIFQVADFVCTLMRIALRLERKGESAKVEEKFFGSVANFRKNWFYPMLKSEWQ